jgi:hypothetical protein
MTVKELRGNGLGEEVRAVEAGPYLHELSRKKGVEGCPWCRDPLRFEGNPGGLKPPKRVLFQAEIARKLQALPRPGAPIWGVFQRHLPRGSDLDLYGTPIGHCPRDRGYPMTFGAVTGSGLK